MIRSMTAFARAERQGEWGTLVWELRSVNHRYLEIGLRMPEELRAAETRFRERIQARLGRGKVDCGLRYRPAENVGERIEYDEAYAKAVIDTCERVEKIITNPARLSVIDVLRWPGVMREPEQDFEPVREAAASLLDEALDELVQTREREGARLEEIIAQRLDGVAGLVQQVRARRPEVLEGIREKMRSRLQALDVEADPGRLEQELALVAQRLDVDEELDRLQTHVDESRAVLGRDEPVGRRLDFLMQEFNREANTLSSKSNDSETTQAAVELKVLIEQMREQVQNIE